MKGFKARSSCLGKIMSSRKGDITEKQLQKIEDLRKKKKEKSLTAKQQELLDSLLEKKKKSGGLSETAKDYLQKWYIENMFGKKRELTNRYLEKGIVVEDESIELLNSVRGTSYKKNEERKENDWISGEPDIVGKDLIIDIKSSWDVFTFPLFEEKMKNKDYEWQLEAYSWLFNKKNLELCYVLVDTPYELILKELNRVKWNMHGTLTEEEETILQQEVEDKMTFGTIPEALRIKSFKFKSDKSKRVQIRKKVRLCRKYLQQWHEQFTKLCAHPSESQQKQIQDID